MIGVQPTTFAQVPRRCLIKSTLVRMFDLCSILPSATDVEVRSHRIKKI